MTKSVLSLFLGLLVFAPSARARTIPYAPFTYQSAVRVHQERTTRHYLLRQGEWLGHNEFDGKVVLYDSLGLEEPRTVHNVDGVDRGNTYFAALYEEKDREPILLLGTKTVDHNRSVRITIISFDGGRSWKRIPELDGLVAGNGWESESPDLGGPWTRGLQEDIRIGGPEYPFVVTYGARVFAISAGGEAKLLVTKNETPDHWVAAETLVAQNRAGTKFVVRTNVDTLKLVSIDGTVTPLVPADRHSSYSGWITADGTIYLQRGRSDGRFLYSLHNGTMTFVSGSLGVPEPNAPPTNWRSDSLSFFAVPTHDFNGAWLVHRDPYFPARTSLSRHAPGGTVEKMWEDASGPFVQALHTGSSGEKLLIQVGVRVDAYDYDETVSHAALAVWRVGDPPPRNYDELFLQDGPTKGFTHLDVETVRSGEPFVFDSGFLIRGGIYNQIFGRFTVFQDWGVVRASLKQHLVLPGVARLPGAFNSFWFTDLVVFNPLDEPQEVDVRFVPLGDGPRADYSVKLLLDSHEIRVIEDVVRSLFELESGGGALHFIPAQEVRVTGRTYSRSGETAGTVGFSTPAIDFFDAYGPDLPVSFAGAFPGANFRTNLLLTDTSGFGARTNLHGMIGRTSQTQHASLDAPASGVSQLNGVSGVLGLSASSRAGGLWLNPLRGTGIANLVAIDNRTNDPTFFPPDLPLSTPRTIPVIGHLDGANGSRFRTDVYLLSLGELRSVKLEAIAWDNSVSQTRYVDLGGQQSYVFEDVLKTMFGMEGLARLEVSVGWGIGAGDTAVRVTSRTYSVNPDGGTAGCVIPPLSPHQMAGVGETLEIIGIVGDANLRTNLGLVELEGNGTYHPTPLRITIIDNRGDTLDSFMVSLPASGGMQINDIFRARGLTPPRAARVLIQVMAPVERSAVVGAYATVTDNITNDSTFLSANLVTAPE